MVVTVVLLINMGVVEFVVLDESKEGGGVEVKGSTSAPLPQGGGAPPGCVAFRGETVLPSAFAIVKQVVHWMSALGAFGVVNW